MIGLLEKLCVQLERLQSNATESTGSEAAANSLWDVAQVAEHLSIPQNGVYALVQKEEIPFLRITKFYRFDPAEIRDWLRQHRAGAR